MFFFKKQKNNESKYYKILSITIVKKVNKKYETKVYLFGVKIYHKKKYKQYFYDLERNIGNEIANNNKTIIEALVDIRQNLDISMSVAAIHENSFLSYYNKFHGRDIVIVGSGPTLNKYNPIDGAIHIALNRSCKISKITFDFIFVQDIHGLKEDIEFINNYPCQKFYGYIPKHQCSIPENDTITANAKRFYTGGRITPFYPDIAHCVLPDYGSVAFSALAFALYTHPKKIYLVGCDVSNGYFFDAYKNADFVNYPEPVLLGWQSFKEFADLYYPEVEIVSINPVTLKGMFKDEITS